MISKKHLLEIFLILILNGIIIILDLIYYTSGSQYINDTVKYSTKYSIEKNIFIDGWKRTGKNYIINISNVNEDSNLKAEYFNPSPINVLTVKWEHKINQVLSDINYTGSICKLNYLADRDIFAGEYFKALHRVTFYLEFV